MFSGNSYHDQYKSKVKIAYNISYAFVCLYNFIPIVFLCVSNHQIDYSRVDYEIIASFAIDIWPQQACYDST